MHRRLIPSLVVILIIALSAVALTVRTKKLWTTYQRQSTREAMESELTVLRHLVLQKAQGYEESLSAAVNGKNPGKFLYTRTLVSSAQGFVAESNEVPNANSYFLKQIDFANVEGKTTQWMRVTDAKGDIYAGLILPMPAGGAAKKIAFGVLKDPFADILEIFKGAFASFMVVDAQKRLIAHTSDEYQGAQLPREMARAMNSDRQEVFLRVGSNKGSGYFMSMQKIPELGMSLAAEIPEKNSLLFWYRWLFEFVAGAIAVLVTVAFVIPRKSSDVVKIKSENAIFKIKKLATHISHKIENEVSTVSAAIKNKTSVTTDVNLKPAVIDALAELQNDIRLYGVEVEDILEDVPNITAESEVLKSVVGGFIRLSISNVHKNTSKKLKIHLRRTIHQIELLIVDNGLPRKTNLDEVLKDVSGHESMASALTQAVSYVKSLRGDVALNYDFYKGNQILVKIPLSTDMPITSSVSTARDLPTTPFSSKSSEAINKRFRQLSLKEIPIPITVRKPKVKEVEND